MNRNEKVLLTGATGFLGAYIIQELLNEEFTNVRAVCRPDSDKRLVRQFEDRVEWVEADLLIMNELSDAISGAKYVIHAAAQVSIDPKEKGLLQEINVEGTANLVNVCLEHGVEKLVHISSIAALSRVKVGTVIDESSEWKTSDYNSEYGFSKYKGELEVWRGIAEGLNAVVLNPSLIIGAGFWDKGTSAIPHRVATNISFYPPGRNGIVDVRDVARAVFLALSSDIKGERIIINAENFTYKKLLQQFAIALKVKQPQKELSPFVAKIACFVDAIQNRITGSKRMISSESLKSILYDFGYNNKKSIELLGMKYRSVNESIIEISKTYLNSTNKACIMPIGEN